MLRAHPYPSELSAQAGENLRPFVLKLGTYLVLPSPILVQKGFLHETGKQSVYELKVQLIELFVPSVPTHILVTVPSDPIFTESVSISIESSSVHALATPSTTEAILLSDIVLNRSDRLDSVVSSRLYRPLLRGIHTY